MRVFQFHSFYKPYLDFINKKYPEAKSVSYAQRLQLILGHRFQAAHILQPAYDSALDFQFTVANDHLLQYQWAREKSLLEHDFKKILLAQIEEHRADVVYALDPIAYDSEFIRSLPGCVKKSICWLASPIGRADLSAYDLRICNFPPFIKAWENLGLKCPWFSPSHDPVMRRYADNEDRPIDISFVGQYSQWHTTRNQLLESVAALSQKYLISFRLMCPHWKPLSRRRYINHIPLPIHYLPKNLRMVSGPPVFGIEMYELFGQSKIVVNAAIDMSGEYRVNMRCFEALGCGAVMVSDEGRYVDGMTPGVHFRTYRDPADAVAQIESILSTPDQAQKMSNAGRGFIETSFPKERQWEIFQALVAGA
jgi:hypothetical protein